MLGASQLARALGISPLIIGVTVVAFGTSAPEIGVSIVGFWKGEGSMVIGNIVGSNIFNTLMILGICAIVTPLVIHKTLIIYDIPIMIFANLLFWILTLNGQLVRLSSLILLLFFILYLILIFNLSKKQKDTKQNGSPIYPVWSQILWIILGLILIGLGSILLVSKATKLAIYFGFSELFIGLTILAIGTSLPELVTSIFALKKGERELAIGNVIGSNILNLFGVMGIAGVLSHGPIVIPIKAMTFDIPVMIGASIATLPISLTGHRISRLEGLLFLLYYLTYIICLILKAKFSHLLAYTTIPLLFFIFAMVILTLTIGLIHHFTHK